MKDGAHIQFIDGPMVGKDQWITEDIHLNGVATVYIQPPFNAAAAYYAEDLTYEPPKHLDYHVVLMSNGSQLLQGGKVAYSVQKHCSALHSLHLLFDQTVFDHIDDTDTLANVILLGQCMWQKLRTDDESEIRQLSLHCQLPRTVTAMYSRQLVGKEAMATVMHHFALSALAVRGPMLPMAETEAINLHMLTERAIHDPDAPKVVT